MATTDRMPPSPATTRLTTADPPTAARSPRPATVTNPVAEPGKERLAEPLDEALPDPADALAGGAETVAVDPTSPAGVAAAARATAFTTAYARPARPDQRRWWAAVSTYLSPQAVLDYQGVLATSVPFTRVTGPARFSPLGDGSERVVLVEVPTDTGRVRVHLLPDAARRWVVTRAEIPPPVSGR